MILVTGAGGTVGAEVLRCLSSLGAPARAGHRSAAKLAAALARGEQATAIDFARPATLAPVLEGVGALFLACGVSPRQTGLELAAVGAARAAGVRRIVKLSVWDAAGEAFSFARLHRPVEREIEDSGMEFTLLRPNGFMQNFVTFLAEGIRARGAFYLPGGSAQVSHVDVRDVGAVAAAALTAGGHHGKAYELSGPEPLTYGTAAGLLAAAIGRPIAYVEVELEEHRQGMLSAGRSAWEADAVTDLARYYMAGRAARVSSAVQDVLGRAPIPFSRFAADHAGAWRPDR